LDINQYKSTHARTSVLKKATDAKMPPENFWHEVQWHRFVETGSPCNVILTPPQRQEPVLSVVDAVDMIRQTPRHLR
jgi:hypothetical protein